ncbi:MAG: hypothetical protein MHM6MM_002669 [Cercozoa sp. M6MM]
MQQQSKQSSKQSGKLARPPSGRSMLRFGKKPAAARAQSADDGTVSGMRRSRSMHAFPLDATRPTQAASKQQQQQPVQQQQSRLLSRSKKTQQQSRPATRPASGGKTHGHVPYKIVRGGEAPSGAATRPAQPPRRSQQQQRNLDALRASRSVPNFQVLLGRTDFSRQSSEAQMYQMMVKRVRQLPGPYARVARMERSPPSIPAVREESDEDDSDDSSEHEMDLGQHFGSVAESELRAPITSLKAYEHAPRAIFFRDREPIATRRGSDRSRRSLLSKPMRRSSSTTCMELLTTSDVPAPPLPASASSGRFSNGVDSQGMTPNAKSSADSFPASVAAAVGVMNEESD